MVNLLALIELLFNGVIPVAFISFFGFYLGKKSIFSYEDAKMILKFVGTVAVPAMSADICAEHQFFDHRSNFILSIFL